MFESKYGVCRLASVECSRHAGGSAKHSRAPHAQRLTAAGASNCASSRRNLYRQQENSSRVATSSLVEDEN
jgi:hypothetical protein